MPVNVDNNLTLKNNTIDATYGELFKKLNVAYGWTHTQTTSSGGTAVVLVNDGDILTTEECNDINQCNIGHGIMWNSSSCVVSAVINGKIYYYNNNTWTQLGTKTDYVIVTGCCSYNHVYAYCNAIDSSGKLWYVTSTSETQVGSDTSWTSLGYTQSSYLPTCGLNNGKIYYVDGSNTPTQAYTNLTNVTNLTALGYSNYVYGYCINNGYLYFLNNTTATLIGNENNWKDIYPWNILSPYVALINGNNELFYSNGVNAYKQNVTNIKKASLAYNGSGVYCLTNDNKLYFGTNLTTIYGNNYGNYIDISNDIEWSDISSVGGYTYNVYAIGDDKLYKIKKTNSSLNLPTYTQIGTESNYKKVEGYYPGSSSAYYIGLAWTGDATTVSHTVLTTKEPQANDAAYIDEDLNQYSTVKTTTGTTITDQYRTYDRDVSKDTSFTAIPPATVHETVSTIDFLRITNPNT